MLLITVRLPDQATLDAALRRLRLSEAEVDTDYGLVPVDPGRRLYALRVTEEAGRRIGAEGAGSGEVGVHADPRIEPFGPPR